MKRHLYSVALVLAAGLAAPSAADAGFRCDTDLVGRGMSFLEVLERCGEPAFEYGWTDYRYPGYVVRVDQWTYDLGDNKFRRELTFENGHLHEIETRRKPEGGLQSVLSARY